MRLAAILKQRALEIGFDLAGVAPLTAWKDLEFSRMWVEQGYGGEMRYLENPKREDPRRILAAAKSVVCVGLIYNAPLPYSTEVCTDQAQQAVGRRQKAADSAGQLESGRVSSFEIRVLTDLSVRKEHGQRQNAEPSYPTAWISRYAWGQDYHGVMRPKLEKLRAAVQNLAPGVETRVYVDTGPIVERAFARYSGIGWVGKNTCLINEARGSWFFLGVMLTNLELEPDLPAPDRCGSCTRCLEACPTGALVEPYVMDASRCISYFTIELKGPIPAKFRSAIGANVFGCDICQDVCPWNSKDRDQGSGVRDQSQDSHELSAASGQPGMPVTANAAAVGSRAQQTKADIAHRARKAATTDVAEEFQPMMVCVRNSECTGTGAGQDHKCGGSGEERQRAESPLPTPDVRHLATETPRLAPNTRLLTPAFSLFNPPLEALASLTEEDFRKVFSHSPVKRVKYRSWLRNLCVAMGNSADPRFVPWLEKAREHEDPIIREHAAWALQQLHCVRELGSSRRPLSMIRGQLQRTTDDRQRTSSDDD